MKSKNIYAIAVLSWLISMIASVQVARGQECVVCAPATAVVTTVQTYEVVAVAEYRWPVKRAVTRLVKAIRKPAQRAAARMQIRRNCRNCR